MTVVVTGATSFIGVSMIRHLTAMGHRVYGIVRPKSMQRDRLCEKLPGLTVVELEMGELEGIGRRISEPCDWFCHFAWDGAGSENRTKRDVQQKNVGDSIKALQGAAGLGCRKFLFSGSQAEYGICREITDEGHPCMPVSEYGKAKVDFGLQAGKLAKKLGMEYLHARIFSVYGPGDHPSSLVESCLTTFLSGGYLSLGECGQLWNFLYIDDLSRALLSLLSMGNQGEGKIAEDQSGYYNVAAPETETRALKEYVRTIYQLCGYHGSYSYGRRPQNAEGPANLIPDIRKLQAATGWEMEVPFEEGIRQMIRKRLTGG